MNTRTIFPPDKPNKRISSSSVTCCLWELGRVKESVASLITRMAALLLRIRGYRSIALRLLPRMALSFAELPKENARIADLGCGTGGQTMILAQNTTKNPGSSAAADYVRSMRYEVNLCEKYKQHYGYVFYIGRQL